MTVQVTHTDQSTALRKTDLSDAPFAFSPEW